MNTQMGRRNFLKGLAVGSVALAGAGLAGCAPKNADAASAQPGSGTGLPASWDEECEVLVVGSGYAGLAAAYEAKNAGADTKVIEKMGTPGGNSMIADGDFAVCMSSAQKAKGIEDSVDKYVADMMAAGLNMNDEEKCRTIAEKSNETWEWTRDVLGVEWDTDEAGNVNVIPYGGHNTVRTLHPKIGHGSAMVQPLLDKLSEMGVEVETGRMLTKLFRDDAGRVVGVQVNKGALIMSVLEPGDLFGAAALFNDRADYATTLTARAPCRVLLLPQALVEELMVRFPEVGRNYVAYLSGRICFLSGKIDALTAGSAERKVAQYLLSRLEGGWVELDCSAAGLARRLGVSRASLYRALDALAGRGVLRREGRRVQVLQPDALEQN